MCAAIIMKNEWKRISTWLHRRRAIVAAQYAICDVYDALTPLTKGLVDAQSAS
jgi:hypothetical protein